MSSPYPPCRRATDARFRLAALALTALVACVEAPAASEVDAGPDEPAIVALVPMSPEVASACAAEVTATSCTTHTAAALERTCCAHLAASGVACATPEACLTTYRPVRDGARRR